MENFEVKNNVCNWTFFGGYMVTECNEKHILSYKGYAHCPYCGKKIKKEEKNGRKILGTCTR